MFLTLDVEVLRVALSVSLWVGGHAGVEAGLGPVHLLQDQGLVADQDTAGHVLNHEFALERNRNF